MKIFTSGILGVMALLVTACGGDGSSAPVATTISVLPNAPTIKTGESVTLTATPVDGNGNVVSLGGSVTWASSAAAVATVSSAGRVTGVSAGTADITATIGRVSGTAKVTVLRLPVARVDIAPTSVTFGRGQTRQLSASLFADDNSALTERTISWTSSNLTVATLSAATGTAVTVTAVAPGTATVSATSEGIKRDVPVTVQPDPVISFSPVSASFGSTAGGTNPSTQIVSVTNAGGGTLSGLSAGAITYAAGQPNGWLTAAFEGSTADPAPLTLRATTGTLAVGTYTATVPVSSTVPGVVAKGLPVTFNIGSAVVLGAAPTTVSFTAPPSSGNPASQNVNVFSVNGSVIPNLALSAVEYTAGQPTGWLAPTLSTAATPATLTLAVTVGTLASGTYTANVPITAPTATNTPLKVPVTLVVPAPTIALSPSTARSFTAAQGVGTAPGQAITITNAGRGALGGLQVSVSYGAGATNWLNANLSSSTAPATLTLTPVANALARGAYTATVQISAAGISNSPQTMSVSYAVIYTFDQHIAGLLANTVLPTGCSNSGCHATGTGLVVFAAGSGDVYARLLSGYVSPGNLGGSLLYQRLSGVPSPMPPSGVVAAIRDAVGAWIQDGARRN